MIFLPIFGYLFIFCFYFIAHKIPNRKWLAIYALFLLSPIGFVFYDIHVAVVNTPEGEDHFSLGWVFIAAFMIGSSYVGIIGVIGRAVVLYCKDKGKNIKTSKVHIASVCTFFATPWLIQLISVFFFFILELPKLSGISGYVGTIGFILSTLCLIFIKNKWLKYI